ncbi:hypothetical protein NDU88_003785 [Pleurodeles waltl]|uniref:Uncharacterized protein n=1 Tax=Pleurodeles waltl TaxID=8319 RepID=A0AAV7PHV6_PLEWA|nr:hypothetical protein NDU88_003785 [Pleurodeles waltl]
MAGYKGDSGEGIFYDDPDGSFEQALVYALDAGVRHTVNVALAQAIQPIKHHLLGFAEQQGWMSHSRIQEELPFSQDPSSAFDANLHQADFDQLLQVLSTDHDYSSSQSLHPRDGSLTERVPALCRGAFPTAQAILRKVPLLLATINFRVAGKHTTLWFDYNDENTDRINDVSKFIGERPKYLFFGQMQEFAQDVLVLAVGLLLLFFFWKIFQSALLAFRK